MAISTYDTLKSSIADFLNRSDLTNVIPTFIDLAEAQINRDIRHWKMERRVTLTATDGLVTLPSDWVGTIEVDHINSTTNAFKRHLELLSDGEFSDRRYNTNEAAGDPIGFRHAVGKIEIFPRSGTPKVELRYMAKVEVLSTLNNQSANFILHDHPDVYLYGSLLHSSPYLVDDQRMAVWAQLYGAAVQRVNQESEKTKVSASTLTMRNKGMNTGAYSAKNYQFRG